MTPDATRAARLSLAPYFLVLALPLAFGVWTFGNYAAGNARDRAEARLEATLEQASATFHGTLTSAAADARVLARSPATQRALARKDRRKLARLAEAKGRVAFFAGGRRLAGSLPADAPRRSVAVTRHGRVVGEVVVGVPLDDALLGRLSAAAGLSDGYRLAVADRGRIAVGVGHGSALRLSASRITETPLAGTTYRVASARLISGRDIELAALVPNDHVTSAEWHARLRVLLAGLAILLGVGVVAYALAPAFARTRMTRQQRAQAAQILSHVGDGVFVVDPAGAISFWNAAAEKITGLKSRDVLGKPPGAAFHRWSEIAPKASPDGANGAVDSFYEIGGKELWLSMTAVSSPIGTVYAFRDLTEQLRFEETRSDFVATVSHELRTPLASIHGAASTLSQRNDRLSEKTRRQLLEIVSEQSERLTDLVDQILLANQLAAGTVHVDRQSFEPERVARSVLEGVRPGLPPHVALDLQAPLGLPLALGDPENTRRVLVNLVENAVKYSPRGGRIDVRIEEHDGQVRFVVRDRGLGIPAAEQERIFEKFYRLDPGMRGGIGGSGLGLYICRELASLMDGRLTVDSSPGRGSSFTFELPVAQAVSAAS